MTNDASPEFVDVNAAVLKWRHDQLFQGERPTTRRVGPPPLPGLGPEPPADEAVPCPACKGGPSFLAWEQTYTDPATGEWWREWMCQMCEGWRKIHRNRLLAVLRGLRLQKEARANGWNMPMLAHHYNVDPVEMLGRALGRPPRWHYLVALAQVAANAPPDPDSIEKMLTAQHGLQIVRFHGEAPREEQHGAPPEAG